MAKKQQYRSFKDGRKATSSLLIVIAICISVLTLGGGGAIYAAIASIDTATASAGITLQVNVNGNDIIVELIGGDRLEHLRAISIVIEGYALPPGLSTVMVIGQDKVTYPKFAVGIRGTHRIGIRGQFDDSPEMLIFQQEFRFS